MKSRMDRGKRGAEGTNWELTKTAYDKKKERKRRERESHRENLW